MHMNTIYKIVLHDIDGSKTVDKMLLEVSAKIGKANSKKELEFFQRQAF